MGDSFTLHGSPHSLPTSRIALMLRLCGEGFTFRHVSFQRGMHLTPEFRALSRWGQVPVLEHNGRAFVQSAAILEYLAETLGCFRATDVNARQHVREWLFWDADRLMPPLWAWYGAVCALGFGMGVLLVSLLGGEVPSLIGVALQFGVTLALFPASWLLIERYEDADVRFR